ncbi:site-2 protease family protein [Waterburya agarophytonicola K14]|uniref:Zinc metalloprotease n=1 Tax=Waterburya agarophytonicola KI4 TaxID=2874699 RepID=A0A964BTJ4_9CYAN|nr:site-2 protease family protein [Waterburya agarophytonicola]MCC0179220.1 site-2 protease family protein [Waterburya agarophytonicola KI4]
MNGNIRIGNLFGIPFFINPSWFFVLGLVTWSYGSNLTQFPELTGIMPWFLGLVAALLLFSSVIAHELGHSFVAISQGISVKSITLFIFGGLATLEKESETPLQAFSVAIAGPLVSVLLFGLFSFIAATAPLSLPIKAIVSLVAYINLVLALFNMIPGLPLDGGNVLKAIVWKITGNPNKGIIFAGRVGQVIGWSAIGLGLLSVLGISQVGSIWTLFIGAFLLRNAGFAAQSATVQDKLSQYTALDAVIPDSPIVDSNLTVREFVNNYVIGKERWKKFLVINEQQQLIGEIAIADLKQTPTSQWNDIYLGELIKPVDEANTILANTSLLEVAKEFETNNPRELVVVGEAGEVFGLLEKSSIINLMAKEQTESDRSDTKADLKTEELLQH